MSDTGHRGLSDSFVDDLMVGALAWVRKRVLDDQTLCLEIRDEYVTVCYRGGVMLKITPRDGLYSFDFDENYLGDEATDWLPDATDDDSWKDAIPNLKNVMDLKLGGKGSKEEREFQQLVIRENNFSGVARSTDYFICDQEYDNRSGARFDLVGVRWLSTSKDRMSAAGLRLALIEMKYGDDALTGSASMAKHLQDIAAFVRRKSDLESLQVEMMEVFRQKRRLGLIDCGKDIQSLAPTPEMLFLLANHDPATRALSDELEKPEFQEAAKALADENVPIRFIQASYCGYGLYDNQLLDLEAFSMMVAEDRKNA